MRKIKSLLAVGAIAMAFTLAQPVTPTSKLANQVSPCITVDAKTTISCKIAKTSGHWKKGNVYKWTITVK